MTARLQGFGLARDQMRSALASGAGISPAGLDALERLEAAAARRRQLGDRLSLTSGAITMLVDRLERAGWVRRRQHPGNRRSVFVELSPQAVELAPPGLASYHARIKLIAAGVSDAHREAVASFLQAAADAAANAVAGLRRRPARGRAAFRKGAPKGIKLATRSHTVTKIRSACRYGDTALAGRSVTLCHRHSEHESTEKD